MSKRAWLVAVQDEIMPDGTVRRGVPVGSLVPVDFYDALLEYLAGAGQLIKTFSAASDQLDKARQANTALIASMYGLPPDLVSGDYSE